MYSTSYRRKLEECLSDLLAPGTNVKSSTLLQAYSTFYAISKEYPSKFSDAYIKVKKSGLSCRLGFLFIPRPPIEAPPAFDLFLKLSPEQFFRFVVPDLVGDPARLMQRFRTKYEENILLLAHRIVQVRRVVYILFSSDNDAKITDSDSYEEAVDKIYNAYCKLEDANKLTRSEFLDFYQLINLYPLDVDETRVSYIGYDKKDLLMVMDLFSNEIELSREQQINVFHRFFVKRHQTEQILDYCRPFHFTRKKDYDSRKELLRNALLKVASIPPLDALCAATLYKKTTVNSLLETSTIKNDVSLENGLIYTLFTSRTLLSLTDDNDFVIFFPSPFFVKKWIADKETKGKNVSFVFTSSALSDLINYH